MNALSSYYFMVILFLLLAIPIFFSLNLWRVASKRKKHQQRIDKFLNIVPLITEKNIREKKPFTAIPDSVLFASILFFPISLFVLGLSLFTITVLDFGLYLCLKTISTMIKTYRLNKLTAALPASLDFLGRCIISGDSFFTAIDKMAHANLPASEEFKPIYEALSVGKPFDETLKKAAIKVNHPDFSLLMAVLIVQQETGRHDIKALIYLSTLLRNKVALRNKIKAGSSEAKLSGYLIAILPLLGLLGLSLFQPDYIMPIFNTKIGQYALIFAGCSNIIGLIMMKKMTQISI